MPGANRCVRLVLGDMLYIAIDLPIGRDATPLKCEG